MRDPGTLRYIEETGDDIHEKARECGIKIEVKGARVTILGKQPKSEPYPAKRVVHDYYCGIMWAFLDPKQTKKAKGKQKFVFFSNEDNKKIQKAYKELEEKTNRFNRAYSQPIYVDFIDSKGLY